MSLTAMRISTEVSNQGKAAGRLCRLSFGSDALIGIAAHRTAAAGIEAPVGRNVLQRWCRRSSRLRRVRRRRICSPRRAPDRPSFALELHEGSAAEDVIARFGIKARALKPLVRIRAGCPGCR